MDLRIFVEPQQGATYDQQLAAALTAEQEGFDAFFRSDHYLAMGEGSGLPGPTDSWVTLGALARETERIRLGTLVTSVTFRHPGPLAISVAQVDQMSGGRVELGLGTGWYEGEHNAYAIPFPPLPQRFAMLEEHLEVLRGMWATPPGTPYSFAGTHYTLQDSPALPKPAQPGGPPVILGGLGPRRTPALAARHAAEYNQPFVPLEHFVTHAERAREACDTIGRDPDDLVLSVALVVCCGEDEAAVARRAGAIGRPVEDLRANGLCGRPPEVLDRLASFAEVGARRVYLQVLDLDDLDHLRLLGTEVLRLIP